MILKSGIICLEPINTFHASYQSDYEPIRLSYHCNIHYNSVIDPYNPSVGVGLGLAGYNPKVGHFPCYVSLLVSCTLGFYIYF